MAIKLPSHLHRARSGVLHFRITIPPDLRHHFGTAEIYRSLFTPNVSAAASAAQTLSIVLKRAFCELRRQSMSDTKDRPQNPKIDLQKLLHISQMAKQRHRHDGEKERLEDEVNGLYRQLRAQAIQHNHELELVLHAQHVAPAQFPQSAFPIPSATSTPLLSDTVEDFIRSKLASGKWTDKTEDENRAVYELCVRVIGNMPVAEIDDEAIISYLEKLKKLPANINKSPAYVGKSIDQIISLEPEPMAARTINKNIERISSLFKWAANKKKYGITHNPAAGLSLSENGSAKRQPFTPNELIALFSSEEFKSQRFENSYAYWLMPMGLLTGARLGELCQLYLSDFIVHNNIHCIDISDEKEGQQLKNPNARRLVPLHDKLIEIGLLRHVEKLRTMGEIRLFPELNLRRDGFSHAASNWFRRHKIKCGITTKQTKVFHSFRHTFISTLLDDEVPEHIIAQIVGHEGKLITSQVYWNARDAAKRKPTIEKYQPPQDVWTLLPIFEKIVFTNRRNPTL
jgi:integrase